MNDEKLLKYIAKPIELTATASSKPILIGNSLVSYLKEQFQHFSNVCDFKFIWKSGTGFPYWYNWLKRHLCALLREHKHITLFVLLGTCDLTIKKGRFIGLRHNKRNTCIKVVTDYIEKINRLVSGFHTCNVVYLETPPYSIQAWNRSKGHSNCDVFLEQDLELTKRINIINDFIRQCNDRSGITVPKFRVDLLHLRRSRGKTRTSLSFKQLRDGIHPSQLLSKYWMKRIVECFQHLQ